jgi:protein involved in polysaccharide export with SLBB domain
VFGLLFGWFCLSGCRTQPQGQQFAEVPQDPAASVTSTAAAPAVVSPAPVPATTDGGAPGTETLRVGDSLTITFTDTPVPIPTFDEKIKDDGYITLTLNQTFKAAGKSRGDLEKEIRARYVPDYYKYMTVSVRQQESTRWYYVDGEVKTPNRWIYNSRITVLQAIASSNGFTDFANKKKVRVTRVDGRTEIVNCVKALGNPKLDLEIYPGDKVHVPRRLW